METEQIGYASIVENRHDLKHGNYLIENVTWDQRRILKRLFPEGLPINKDSQLCEDWLDIVKFPHLTFEYPEFTLSSASHVLTFDPMFQNETWPSYGEMHFLQLLELLAIKYFPDSYKGH